MKILSLFLFLCCLSIHLSACSEFRTVTDLTASNKLRAPEPGDAVKKTQRTKFYANPEYLGKQYKQFILEPVEIYNGKDHDFGTIPKEEIKKIANYITKSFTDTMTRNNGYRIVEAGRSADILRVKFTLVGISRTVRTANALAVLTPMGLVINTTSSLAGGQGAFMGDVTLAGEFYDSNTDTLVGAFLVKRYPMNIDVTTWLDEYDAARSGIDEVMDALRKRTDRVNGVN